MRTGAPLQLRLCVRVCTWLRRALRLGGALMAAVSDLLGEGLQAEKKKVSEKCSITCNLSKLLGFMKLIFVRFNLLNNVAVALKYLQP